LCQEKVVLLTNFSFRLLFFAFLVAATLTPLSASGPVANKFNNLGMWASIGMVLALYLLPLIVYLAGVEAMRYVMAVLCSFGVLINLAVIPVVMAVYAILRHFA
jgi:hypothetical protein